MQEVIGSNPIFSTTKTGSTRIQGRYLKKTTRKGGFLFFVKNRAFQSLFVRLFVDSLSKHTASTEKRSGANRLPESKPSGADRHADARPFVSNRIGTANGPHLCQPVRHASPHATPGAPRRRCPYPYRWIAAPRCGWKSPAACPRQAGRFCPAARSSRRRGKPSPPAYFRAA